MVTLPVGGFYKLRRHGGETHAFDADADPHCCRPRSRPTRYQIYRRYAEAVRKLPPVALRDLLDFRSDSCTPISVDEVESITEIRKRLVAPGISLGALSPEAHETLSIAMNRIGAQSDSGEGGEDPARYKPRANGDNAVVGDQADRLGPVRRHRRIPQQLPRDRDQGRAGRQARRGRPAARLQGYRR